VFEAKPRRIEKSLSDLGGTDVYIHHGRPSGVFSELTSAFVRAERQPSVDHMKFIFSGLVPAERAGNDAQVGKSHGLNDLMRRRVACESVGAQAAGIDISTYPDEFQTGPTGLPVGAEKTVCLLA
jgi:hypothetical protein